MINNNKTTSFNFITTGNGLHPVSKSKMKAWVAWDDGTRECRNVLGNINQGQILFNNSC